MSPGELHMEAAHNNSCVITIVGYHGNSVYWGVASILIWVTCGRFPWKAPTRFGEDGNTAPSLHCAISPYLQQYILAEHLSFSPCMSTSLPSSESWQTCHTCGICVLCNIEAQYYVIVCYSFSCTHTGHFSGLRICQQKWFPSRVHMPLCPNHLITPHPTYITCQTFSQPTVYNSQCSMCPMLSLFLYI
jgi:hypothetical protein